MGERGTFTPGPWKASETEPRGDYCIHAAGIPWQLAYLSASPVVDWPLEADARLIAAAPDLYGVLSQIVTAILDGDETGAHQIASNAGIDALAKAGAPPDSTHPMERLHG